MGMDDNETECLYFLPVGETFLRALAKALGLILDHDESLNARLQYAKYPTSLQLNLPSDHHYDVSIRFYLIV